MQQEIRLPDGVVPVPVLFQRAGYYTCIGSPIVARTRSEDGLQLRVGPGHVRRERLVRRKPANRSSCRSSSTAANIRGQRPNQAWEDRVRRELGSNTRPDSVSLPPYYPRDPLILQDWADYLDACRYTDKEVGDVVARLEKESLLEETVIFFMTDHGISHARGKQFLYDEGTHVPFVVRGPGIGRGVVRDDLIEHIDLAATSLTLAGIEVPKWMQGRNVLAADYVKRDAVFGARDRCDETIDHIRSVRTAQFKYIRNYLNKRPLLQPCAYKDDKAIVQQLRVLHAGGKLDSLQETLLFAPSRPAEELYDLAADPHELSNLAGDSRFKRPLDAHAEKARRLGGGDR